MCWCQDAKKFQCLYVGKSNTISLMKINTFKFKNSCHTKFLCIYQCVHCTMRLAKANKALIVQHLVWSFNNIGPFCRLETSICIHFNHIHTNGLLSSTYLLHRVSGPMELGDQQKIKFGPSYLWFQKRFPPPPPCAPFPTNLKTYRRLC